MKATACVFVLVVGFAMGCGDDDERIPDARPPTQDAPMVTIDTAVPDAPAPDATVSDAQVSDAQVSDAVVSESVGRSLQGAGQTAERPPVSELWLHSGFAVQVQGGQRPRVAHLVPARRSC